MGGSRGDFLTPFVLETFDRRKNQPEEKKQAATCGDVSWQPVKAKAVGGIKVKVWQWAEENFWYRYLENWCGGQKKRIKKMHHWNENSYKGNGNDKPQLWVVLVFKKKKNGKRPRRSSPLLLSEQNYLGGSGKKAWRRTADRLPNQQVLPETRTKKGGVNGSYGKRTR